MTRPPSPLTLVVLAAGMGSRYGGLKQLDAVGPGGATLMDYAVFDAARTGFHRVLFVIRPDMEEAFRPFASERYGERIAVITAHQRLDDLPPGSHAAGTRTRPWGTAQAVLATASQVSGPFAVVNADDFYGLPAYEAVVEFLTRNTRDKTGRWAVVGYRLRDTLSDAGGVNRALCRTEDGLLVRMTEVFDIRPGQVGALKGRDTMGPVTLEGNEMVSMNMWAFTPAVFDALRRGFAQFLASPGAADAEYLLPTAVEESIRDGAARVEVLDAHSPWFGMTYPEDRPAVVDALARLAAAGAYEEKLF